jgi:hypothetical protein
VSTQPRPTAELNPRRQIVNLQNELAALEYEDGLYALRCVHSAEAEEVYQQRAARLQAIREQLATLVLIDRDGSPLETFLEQILWQPKKVDIVAVAQREEELRGTADLAENLKHPVIENRKTNASQIRP